MLHQQSRAPKPPIHQSYPTRSLVVEPEILHQVGPVGAVIIAVLQSKATSQGVEMAIQDIADESGISRSTAIRHLQKLQELGYLKSENQIIGLEGQRFNRYHTLVPGCQNDTVPEFQNDIPLQHMSMDREVIKDQRDNKGLVISSSPSLDLDNSSSSSEDVVGKPRMVSRWTAPGSPMPVTGPPRHGKKNLAALWKESSWLVMHLEGLVLARTNQDRESKGWKALVTIPNHRKVKWLASADRLLATRDLGTVVKVIDWLFEVHDGWVPFTIFSRYGLVRRDEERKVTDVRKLLDNWELLQGLWAGQEPTDTMKVPQNGSESQETASEFKPNPQLSAALASWGRPSWQGWAIGQDSKTDTDYNLLGRKGSREGGQLASIG